MLHSMNLKAKYWIEKLLDKPGGNWEQSVIILWGLSPFTLVFIPYFLLKFNEQDPSSPKELEPAGQDTQAAQLFTKKTAKWATYTIQSKMIIQNKKFK